MEISNIEYLVIVAYLMLIIVVGFVFKRFSANTDDYFKGGSKGTWWLVGSSAFMSAFSAWTFTGAAGIAYESGFSAMFIFIGNALGFFVNFLFMISTHTMKCPYVSFIQPWHFMVSAFFARQCLATILIMSSWSAVLLYCSILLQAVVGLLWRLTFCRA